MRIGEDARKCVVFFGVPDGSGGVAYGGTGFLVAYFSDETPEVAFTYVVTAKHVADGLEQWDDTGFSVRVNTKDGGSVAPSIVVQNWVRHPDPTVDLAAFSANLSGPNFDQKHYSLRDNWADPAVPNSVVCGDDVNLVGLFRLHAGSKRNVPIVHAGNIAALPDAQERVPLKDRTTNKVIECEVYLIEAQTLDGLSGSPVFVHEVVSHQILTDDKGKTPKMYGGVSLLGIYTGAWDAQPGVILEADRNLKGGVRVPVGMGTVVPAPKLIELLRDHPTLKNDRKVYVERKNAERAAQQDSAFPARDDSADRLQAVLRGAFAGPPTPLKNIPKRDGRQRKVR